MPRRPRRSLRNVLVFALRLCPAARRGCRRRARPDAGFSDLAARSPHFENLRADRGRFRAFLLASFQNFLAKDHARRNAQKRGSDVAILSLSFEDAEGRYRFEPAEPATPETLYERRWALTVIDRVLGRLRQEWESKKRAAEFDELKACLLGEAPSGGVAAIAQRLGLSETAVRVSVHRLKRKFQAQLKRRSRKLFRTRRMLTTKSGISSAPSTRNISHPFGISPVWKRCR